MIVYDNLGSKKVSELLSENSEWLRSNSYVLEYEPESDIKICLENIFDIPTISIWKHGEHTNSYYAASERIDQKFAEASALLFGRCSYKPYSEWLTREQRLHDEDKTRREVEKLINSCRKRLLSPEFKQQMKDIILAM